MKTRSILSFILIKKQTVYFALPIVLMAINLIGCGKGDPITPQPQPQPQVVLPTITSEEFKNDLLFVNQGDFQIQTSDAATFSSTDPKIQISAAGLIKRITSAEVVPIDITWTNQSGAKTRIYALGATDNTFDEPYASFHGVHATNPLASYQQGWQTLQKLPIAGETYAIILRHADADKGKDFSVTTGPPNWWLSCDTTRARQLNEQGMQRSEDLGNVFKDLHYPITRVIASEFCRAKLTAELINMGPPIVIDSRINHNSHNISGLTLFQAMIAVMSEQPVDNNMTLISSHHPMNEVSGFASYSTFPAVSPFTWTAAYFVKIDPNKTITYEGAVSWGMFKYWRDKKLNLL